MSTRLYLDAAPVVYAVEQVAEFPASVDGTSVLERAAKPDRPRRAVAVAGFGEGRALPMTVRDAIRLVERDGWVEVRQTGSHRQHHHPPRPGTVTISGKTSLDLDPKTEKSIRRQAGLS